jgi:cytochrome c oxidase subunit I
MSMTETRPEVDATEATAAPDVHPLPPEPTGLAGVFSTADHKRIGRYFIATSLVFLVVGAVMGALLGAERIDSGLTIFDEATYTQVFALQGEVLVLLFLVPFFLGLATYLVPLQIGAPDIAFARGSATAYWTYLLSGLVLLGAYVADGGITGGDAVAVDLYLLAIGALAVATVVALISILTTIVTHRAPGMTLDRAPMLTFAFLAGGGALLLATPVLVARVLELFIAHQGGTGEAGPYESLAWYWSVPTVHLLLVPVFGVVLDVVAVHAGTPLRQRNAATAVVGAAAILGFGAFAQVSDGMEGVGGLVYVALGIGSLLPVLALVGLVGDTVRRGRLAVQASMLMALGAVVHLFLGALAGATLVIEPLELVGTAWESAQFGYTVVGAGILGAFAALWFWAPKLWGVHLGEAVGKLVFLAVFLGALLLSAPDLVNGLVQDLPRVAPTFEDDGLTVVLNIVSLAGGALVAVGVLLAFGDVLGRAGRRTGKAAGPDPWGGHTLEWATTSPPPRNNFADAIPVVTSATPTLAPDTEVPA